jgi:NAD(P)-dependent dehydrogenase (short-subunit alcohol dehydrogenase family)
VTDPALLANAVKAAAARFGHVNGWVNNAGVVQMMPAKDYTPQIWRHEFEINVTGVINGTQAAFRAFNGQGGAIVNVASNARKGRVSQDRAGRHLPSQ